MTEGMKLGEVIVLKLVLRGPQDIMIIMMGVQYRRSRQFSLALVEKNLFRQTLPLPVRLGRMLTAAHLRN